MELEPTLDLQADAITADSQGLTDSSDEALVEEELLVEEISIDGMCGVY